MSLNYFKNFNFLDFSSRQMENSAIITSSSNRPVLLIDPNGIGITSLHLTSQKNGRSPSEVDMAFRWALGVYFWILQFPFSILVSCCWRSWPLKFVLENGKWSCDWGSNFKNQDAIVFTDRNSRSVKEGKLQCTRMLLASFPFVSIDLAYAGSSFDNFLFCSI